MLSQPGDRLGRRITPHRLRRYVWSTVLFLASLLILLYIRAGDNFDTRFEPLRDFIAWDRNSGTTRFKTVDELKALLYMLTSSEEVLPDDFDVEASPLDISVLSEGEQLSNAEWSQRIEIMDKLNPLIVFSKTYCPFSAKAKSLLVTYDIHPPPRIIEVDLRQDANLIKSLLTRYTFHSTFPNIVLRGKTLGGSDDLQRLHESGQLRQLLERAGLSVGAEGDPEAGVVNKLPREEDRLRRRPQDAMNS